MSKNSFSILLNLLFSSISGSYDKLSIFIYLIICMNLRYHSNTGAEFKIILEL